MFWQPRAHVFLDKVCIHQTDAEKKQRGVDGLAGFLNHSEEILVLWDRTYFTRLWCTFEIAAYVYLHGSDLHNRVVPIIRGYSTILVVVAVFAVNVIAMLSTYMPLLSGAMEITSGLVFAVWVVHMTRNFTRQRLDLRTQMVGFRCDEASCFCCSMQHVMPDTKAPIKCDRIVIYGAIRSWFTGGLEEFEGIVHSMFASMEHCMPICDELY